MSFFITSIAYYPDKERYNQPHKCFHTFGHFSTLQDAQSAVAKNEGGLDECLYNYLVIEEIGYGIYAGIANWEPDSPGKGQWWYRWDNIINDWWPMIKPDWSKQTINWAM